LSRLQSELTGLRGVDQVTPFGASLHVSGRDRAALEAAIDPYRGDPRLTWDPAEPSLEDVFIDLMGSERNRLQ
jgi:ABC-2 type transport system ATP-binding protein